ncbi:PaaX family transcriptional regulator C-terminal domain-containing protein [Arthrobacter sp. BE255]|uniref:PaaX family transcriptional regulator n=1 Tax=Arthrobacter sp. BE255 TaxID=2817721 RepID=UPI0028585A00|nr:PaaX family transcriptional regulator C-terminal domain-containing protein [Arthrobacter sp. BE255]MDR7161584.1 phenylacetic acid degradation operon negative regulatory protein [Arthrobacter sp. BE255]
MDFPRPQKGNASQHLLVTMLAEFWRKTDLWLPARVVVRLAEDVGLSRPAVTTALSRLAARGVLENDGGGRASRYRFTAAARDRLVVGHKQITEFGDPSVDWDRHWTAVAFSIPETDRDIREAFRARLKWLGFAPVYGALWFSPRDRVAQVTETAEGYGVDDFMAFRLEDTALQGRRPAVINSQDLPERYAAFAQKNESRLERLRQPGADPREAFRMRIETMDEWRAFPWDDAGMPYELLPADWPLRPARSTFIDVYRATAEGALQYIHGVLTESAPEAIPGTRLPEIP